MAADPRVWRNIVNIFFNHSSACFLVRFWHLQIHSPVDKRSISLDQAI